jgi:hypothetical protein
MKPIRLTRHVEEQLRFRGASAEEIFETIKDSKWLPAELDRLEARKNFTYAAMWNDKFYKIKQVRPIFSEEENEIVVVTVYVYYF